MDPAGGAAGWADVGGSSLADPPGLPSVPFKLNQDRRHHIPKQKHAVTNAAAYDASLRQRGSLTVWFTDDAVAASRLRQTEGLIASIIHLLGFTPAVPDQTTLSRRAETLEVPRPRSGSDSEPIHLLVDSTGLKLCGADEWPIEKHGTKTRRS